MMDTFCIRSTLLAALIALIALIALVGCKHASAPPPPTPTVASIPRTTVPIKIDGEWDEPDWSKVALRGQFLGKDGKLSRPTSEVRFLHDDHDLFVGLYAADDNIQSTDAFDLHIGALAWHLDATGKVTPATPGLRSAIDRDGSLDDPKNYDEEWLYEVAIPLATAAISPGRHADVTASRCDTPKNSSESCASWTGSLDTSP